jgi:quinol monooxygenase YgiN
VVAISLWENRASAEAYNTNTYPEVLKTFARLLDGTPKVQTFESVTSTFHNVAVAA